MAFVLPGLPSQHELRFWFPAHPNGLEPGASLETPLGTPVVPAPIVTALAPKANPNSPIGYRAFASGLEPDRAYVLRVRFPGDPEAWVSASVRTLPVQLLDGFTMATASCYALSEDRGDVGAGYPPSRLRFESSIRLRLLTGDQVYMDMDPFTGGVMSNQRPDPWAVYRAHWSNPGYASFLAATPTGYLADDHEYWNDFPHGALWLKWAGDGLDNPTGRAADEAFTLYQTALNPAPGEEGAACEDDRQFCRSFQLDVSPLSILALDCRTLRTFFTDEPSGFFRRHGPEWTALRRWITHLSGPGVLSISQPPVEEPASGLARFFHAMGDVNLPDYGEDFRDLWKEIFASEHDILVVTGDIHVSRVSRVDPIGVPGASGRRVYEIVASPLCHIRVGAEDEPDPSLSFDASGSLDLGYSANAHTLAGSAHRRMYATLEFTRFGPGIDCRVSLWGADVPGARLLREVTLRGLE